MTVTRTGASTPQRSLRLWPGVIAITLLLLVWLGLPLVVPGTAAAGMLAGIVSAAVIVVWWAFFSRAPHLERWSALALMVLAPLVASRLIHKSIANGMMGMMFPLYAIPTVSLAFAVAVVGSYRLSNPLRRVSMAVAILLACGLWTVLRTDGITGDGASKLTWRWRPTAEDRLLAKAGEKPVLPANLAASPAPAVAPAANSVPVPTAPVPAAVIPATPASLPVTRPAIAKPVTAANTTAVWPGFRGPHRDSVIPGVQIETDWTASPPVALWKRPVGPGWSSFAVSGDFLYTQEQRGQDEIVSCYNASSGEPVWTHRDTARFWESNAGAGPRATPTLSNGRVYTLGATGILNALDASSGAVVWSRNAGVDTGTKIPGWGFASSPLVIDDVVIVAASGRLAGYDVATGHPRWLGPLQVGGYSSPQLMTIDGTAQVLLMNGAGVISVAPSDGAVLWQHSWPGAGTIIQPAITANGDVLVTSLDMSGGVGTRRLGIAHGPEGWKVEERWTSAGLKPYFNDFVVHGGYAYGFDGSILACIDLKDGTRRWKGGRYGHGQIVLLADQNLLLVLSEEGELALVGAVPDQFKEIARFPAIEGKTWNHPVLAGERLLVRNGQEMAAFRLTLRR